MGAEKTGSRASVLGAVARRATGYETSESVDEYVLTDGELTLVKRRVTVKEVPPDVAAARLLLELSPDETENMSEAEIAAEKKRLIALLVESEEKGGTRRGKKSETGK